MSFANEPFSHRFQTMGDIAERKFEELCDRKFCRYGLNRPPIHMGSLPLSVRHTPDYLTSESFVEVQGLGSDQVLKLKLEKMRALRSWHRMHRVVLFVYDSSNDRHANIPLAHLQRMCKNAEVKLFPEGKEYYAIPAALVWADESQSNTN